MLLPLHSRQASWRLGRGGGIVIADPAGDVPKPLDEGFLGNGNDRVRLGEQVVHGYYVVVLDVCEHLLAKCLASRILDCPHIPAPCRRGAGKYSARPAVETEHIEVTIL